MCLYYSNAVFTHTDRGREGYRNLVKLKLEEFSFCLFVCFEWTLLCRSPHREHCLPGQEAAAAASAEWTECHHRPLQRAALKAARRSVTATLRPTLCVLSILLYSAWRWEWREDHEHANNKTLKLRTVQKTSFVRHSVNKEWVIHYLTMPLFSMSLQHVFISSGERNSICPTYRLGLSTNKHRKKYSKTKPETAKLKLPHERQAFLEKSILGINSHLV